MKKINVLFALCLLTIAATAQPPLPPLGERWVYNAQFSDEFNGTELDKSKWLDYHPNWKGREPGLFMPSQVKVENGYLKLWSEKMDKDTVITNWDGTTSTYNIKCAAVVSKTQEAHFGYYECRFKASATTMSSTFWLSTRGSAFNGPESCNDKYSQEWDIQECIGREGDFDGKWFAKGMHANSHFWYTDCDGVKHDHRAPGIEFEDEKLASEEFDVYGGWWKDESHASYYYKGESKSHTFYTAILDKPFPNPMGVNLVHETYPFPWISLPTDEELADTSKNYVLYDWVRAYYLKGVDETVHQGATEIFPEKIFFSDSAAYQTSRQKLYFKIAYMANYHRQVNLRLFNAEDVLIGEQAYVAMGGYGHKEYELSLDSVPSERDGYYLIADIRTTNGALSDTFQTSQINFELVQAIDLEINVNDSRDDSPIEDAIVIISEIAENTNASGQTSFSGLNPGTIIISVEKEGYVSQELTLVDVFTNQSVSVSLIPVSYTMKFLLTNDYTEEAISDVAVEIDDDIVNSDYNGEAQHFLYADDYVASLSHPRYHDSTISFSIAEDRDLAVALRQSHADAKIVIKLDDKGLYDALISIGETSASTNTVGITNLSDLNTNESYNFKVSYDGETLEETTLLLKTDTTIRKYYYTENLNGNQASEYKIYPNPTKDKLKVYGARFPISYQIMDLTGKTIFASELREDETIGLQNLKDGIYFLKTDEKVFKFIISR